MVIYWQKMNYENIQSYILRPLTGDKVKVYELKGLYISKLYMYV